MENAEFSIGNNILIRCTSQAEEVLVPQGIEIIGERAFCGASTARKIVLPEGVREIRARAFYERKALRTVVLPATVETIGEEAFYGCQNLKRLELPDSVNAIGNFAFQGCGFEEFRLPQGITVLRNHIFPESLKTLILHKDVKRVDYLYHLPNLTSIRFPTRLARDPRSILDWWLSYKQVSIEAPGIPLHMLPKELKAPALMGLAEWEYRGNKVSKICDESATSYLKDHYPEFREKAQDSQALLAFLLRRNLVPWQHAEAMLELAQARNEVERTAMLLNYLRQFQTPEVEEQRMTEMLQELETGFLSATAFDALWEADRGNHRGLVLTRYLGASTTVTIPAGRENRKVGEISRDLFFNNHKITEVQIPEGIQKLASWCFAGCVSLRAVTLPSTLTEIPECAFAGCRALEYVCLTSGPRVIRRNAFLGCRSLTELRIPKSVEIVESGAFTDCYSLEAVRLPAYAQIRRKLLRDNTS